MHFVPFTHNAWRSHFSMKVSKKCISNVNFPPNLVYSHNKQCCFYESLLTRIFRLCMQMENIQNLTTQIMNQTMKYDLQKGITFQIFTETGSCRSSPRTQRTKQYSLIWTSSLFTTPLPFSSRRSYLWRNVG